jgi:hypothetical protein
MQWILCYFNLEALKEQVFSTPQRSDRLSGPPSLHSNGYWGLFPRRKSGRGVKLTTHLHIVPRSRMAELYLHFECVLMAWCLINQAQGQLYLKRQIISSASVHVTKLEWLRSIGDVKFWKPCSRPSEVFVLLAHCVLQCKWIPFLQ